MPPDPDDIRDRLLQFAARLASSRVSGAAAHDDVVDSPLIFTDFDAYARAYNRTFFAPLDAAVLDAFERTHGISLPDDYRFVLTEVCNGSVGGLFPFGYAENRRWEDMGVVSHVGQPFPHDEAWNLDESFWDSQPNIPKGMPPDEEHRILEEWDQREYEAYWNPALTSGAIPICDLGCGLGQWLVVHGPQCGCVWNDFRADHRGLLPALDADGSPLTFSGWCLEWMADVERTARHRSPDVRFLSHAARKREWLQLLLLIVVGVLLGLILAYARH